ncbi:4a-hydroxytetrahydrobiopterin dehydratase [Ruicaihuangia caeni]|uniref:Putative pterin-4-alpha-carbinolamine dehydratase n=1 Tax=Ruicaihuangia caeni TaxID=3042517 RepID=A0AAW6T687_9MICO|nr:4a-hydroxytetrahydrobiopterin dehydratase [Klugiella sp. YN-L-19]MDI2098596.1 4a-hydroxytetrahydrobiopterin dehydratase [Klugiella sp. YN-L-19]
MTSTLDSGATSDALEGTAFTHEGDALVAHFDTKDFAGAMRLLNAVADSAESLNHHPDVELGYGRLDLRLTSHEAGGVTDLDLELARHVQAAARELGYA